jgi:hypothetical protein
VFLNDARATFSSGLINRGEVQVTFGESELAGRITTESGGKVVLSGRTDTTFHDMVEVQAGGELRVSAGATAVFFGPVLQRTGSLFTGNGAKFYEGGLSIGDSPGVGIDAGDVSFAGANVYLAEIGGTTPGTGFDFYDVKGTLTFGGTLRIVSFDSFAARAGQRFDLFDAGGLQGQFDRIDASGLQLADGARLDVSRLYVDGSVSVTAVPEPSTLGTLMAGLAALAWRFDRMRRRSRDSRGRGSHRRLSRTPR